MMKSSKGWKTFSVRGIGWYGMTIPPFQITVTCSFVSERCVTQQFISLMQKPGVNLERSRCPGNSGEAIPLYARPEQFKYWRSDQIHSSQAGWFKKVKWHTPEELPHHITDIDTLIKLKEILSVQLNNEKKRGVDYRNTLIYLTIALYETATRDVRALLASLCEMVEVFYAQDRKRCPKLILRLYNLRWRHALLCWKLLTPPRALTSRKLSGNYSHACASHSAFLLRLVSHRSINA